MMTSFLVGVIIIIILIVILIKKRNNKSHNNDTYPDFEKENRAEKIVNNYGAALTKGTNGIARPISLLKNSKKEIVKAFKYYVKSLKKHDMLTDKVYWTLAETYSFLEHFVEDDLAEKINYVHNNRLKGDSIDPTDHKIYQEFKSNVFLKGAEKMNEFSELVK